MHVVFLGMKRTKLDIPIHVAVCWVFISGHPAASKVFVRSTSQSIGQAMGRNRERQSHDGCRVRYDSFLKLFLRPAGNRSCYFTKLNVFLHVTPCIL